MRLPSRFLGDLKPSPPPSRDSPAGVQSVDSDFVVILAALLCALICVLGLVAVARCAWIRRISGRAVAPPPSNKGLKKGAIRSLPKVTYGAEDAGKYSDCAICLAEFDAGDEIRILPQCGHGFHAGCIDTWLGSHSSCPSCRQILVVGRCDKCGELPRRGSSSWGLAAGEAEPRLPPRDHHFNMFLP